MTPAERRRHPSVASVVSWVCFRLSPGELPFSHFLLAGVARCCRNRVGQAVSGRSPDSQRGAVKALHLKVCLGFQAPTPDSSRRSGKDCRPTRGNAQIRTGYPGNRLHFRPAKTGQTPVKQNRRILSADFGGLSHPCGRPPDTRLPSSHRISMPFWSAHPAGSFYPDQ